MQKLFLFLLAISLTGPLWAQPSGTFWVGESEGDDFESTLRFEGSKVMMTPLSEEGKFGPEKEVTSQEIGENLFLLRGEELHAYVKFRDQDEAMMWYAGDPKLYWLIKGADQETLPLSGSWKALGGSEVMAAQIDGNTMKLRKDSGEEVEWSLHPLVEDRGEARAVVFFAGQDSFLMYLVRVEADLWLLRNHEEETSLFLYRGEELEARMSQELKSRLENEEETVDE